MNRLQAIIIVAAGLVLTTCVTEYHYNWSGPIPDEGGTQDIEDKDASGGDVTIDIGHETIHVPECEGRECGPDGIGNSCWVFHNCPETKDCLPECDDGNLCNGPETCNTKDGVCEQGEAVVVDDGIDCTVDSCDEETGEAVHTPDDTQCDNGKACDGLEICDPQQDCVAGEAPEIDDGVDCTVDDCDDESGSVTHTPDDTKCDDENPCTTDSCHLSDDCVHDSIGDGNEPPDNGCEDGNPCTKDHCFESKCSNPLYPLDELLDDIEDGNCICQQIEDCAGLEDPDMCNGILECRPIPDDPTPEIPDDFKACQIVDGSVWSHDGLFCNGLETCDPATGNETAGIGPNLDDGYDCTDDWCDEETDQVVHDPVDAECEDGDVCTENTCSPDSGCVWVPANQDGPCVPTDPCIMNALCDNGICSGVSRAEVAVADGGCLGDNLCKSYGCQADGDGGSICTSQDNPEGICSDNDECTVGDACVEGACVPGEPVDCNDNIDCTTEVCNPESGQCDFTYDNEQCDDFVDCTVDSCDGQGDDGCLHEVDHDVCDDLNPCTLDECLPEEGCIHTPLEGQCDDDDECTLNDECIDGICTGQPDIVNCADWDHDEVLGAADLCPYAYDPQQLDMDDNDQMDACESMDIIDLYTRPVILTEAGAASQWRRTHEPFELPLANGIIDDSLIGYWKLDDGQAVDYSGNGNHGTVTGAVAGDGAFGDGDGGLVFDGDDSVSVQHNNVHWGAKVTVSLWANLASFDTDHMLFEKWKSDGNHDFYGINAYVSDSGQLTFQVHTPASQENHQISVSPDGLTAAGQWVLLTHTFDGQRQVAYVNGKMVGANEGLNDTFAAGVESTKLHFGASAEAGNPGWAAVGSIDEVLIFNRALTPDEIETYYRSSAPFGTRFAPGAQADFDDLRVTETSGLGDPEDTGTTVKRSRVIGLRPHSDTPCPALYAATPVQGIPGIASREDLCGVAAYWRLDGEATDVLGVYDGEIHGATPARGRFGDSSGAMDLSEDDYLIMPESDDYSFDPDQDDFTVELWVHPSGEGSPGQTVITDRGESNDPVAFRLTYNHNYKTFNLSSHDGAIGQDCATLGAFPAGKWYHVVLVFSEGQRYLYIDGAVACQDEYAADPIAHTRPVTLGRVCTPGCSNYFHGTIDEVIIHNVAKSADYIYHRGAPGLPKVRFLVNSEIENAGSEEAPAYPMRDYTLHWGDANAGMRPVFVSASANAMASADECWGLLNGCHGYAGWWRFNEGSGTVAVDSSGWKRNGAFDPVNGGITWMAGKEGTAIYMPGEPAAVALPGEAFDGVEDFAGEVYFAHNVPDDYSPSVLNLVGPAFENELILAYHGPNVPPDAGTGFHVVLKNDKWNGDTLVAPNTLRSLGVSRDGDKLLIQSDGLLLDEIPIPEENQVPLEVDPGGAFIGVDQDCPGGCFDTKQYLTGVVDNVRFSSRTLALDEFLHFPMASYTFGDSNWNLVDTDGDGIPDDGDFSGSKTDNPCKWGQVLGCDDNAQTVKNPDQADQDGDGVGTIIDNCPDVANPGQEDGDGDGVGDACEVMECHEQTVWFLPLDDNTYPAEWDIILQGDNSGVMNERLEAHPTDGSARLNTAFLVPEHIPTVILDWDGSHTSSAWGARTGIIVHLKDGSRLDFSMYTASAEAGAGDFNQVRIRHVTAEAQVTFFLQENLQVEAGEFHYRVVLSHGVARFVGTYLANDAPYFDFTSYLPVLILADITMIEWQAHTTSSDIWADNLLVQFACGNHIDDSDHDGIADGADSCPFAFDPQQLDLDNDGDKDACEPLAGDFAWQMPLVLSQEGGASTWRRTHEPVEVPLANGIVDDSVVGYWKLDGPEALDWSGNGNHATLNNEVDMGVGVFGDENGAFDFIASTAHVLLPFNMAPDYLTVMAWVNVDHFDDFGDVFVCLWNKWSDQQSFWLGATGGTPSIDVNIGGEVATATGTQNLVAGQWTHVAGTYDGMYVSFYMNGRLMARTLAHENGVPTPIQKAGHNPFIGAEPGSSQYDNRMNGRIDEALLFNRALTPDEIGTYVQSSAPYGTNFFAGAQGDYDDLRVTEKSGGDGDGDGDGNGDGNGKETVKRSRVIGVRPHSDTPCPAGYDGLPAEQIPGIESRDDLCGVMAYWPAAGLGDVDVTGQYGVGKQGVGATSGRFGEPNTALQFNGSGTYVESVMLGKDVNMRADLEDGVFTIEAWYLRSASGAVESYLFSRPYDDSSTSVALYGAAGGDVRCKLHGTEIPEVILYGPAMAVERWQHAACSCSGQACRLYVDGLEVDSAQAVGTLDFSNSHPAYIGSFDYDTHGFTGKIAEVLIHGVAKSPDYIYHRANPGVPKVRYLGNTVVENQGTDEAPSYPVRQYTMYWGDEDAAAAMPFVSSLPGAPAIVPDACFGLLSGCHGYAGWWRFNEGGGTVAVDSSGWKRNGEMVDGPAPAAGLAGASLQFDGLDDRVSLPHEAMNGLGDFSVDVASLLTGTQTEPTLLSAESAPGKDAFQLRHDEGEKDLHIFVNSFELGEAEYDPVDISTPGWHWLGLARLDAHLSVFHNGNFAAERGVQGDSLTVAPEGLQVGTEQDAPGGAFQPQQWWHGSIDEVRISSRSLEPDEFLHYPMLRWSLSAPCTPDCAGKACGDDGCGGSCGVCGDGEVCSTAGKCALAGDHGMVWVPIPAGDFMMGCSEGDQACYPAEKPPHLVAMESFEILEAEVTQGQWDAVLTPETNPTCNRWEDDLPVECVKHVEAVAFCEAADPAGRLCSEAEWEHAARAGTETRYYCGDDEACLDSIAWFDANSEVDGNAQKHAVKGLLPNAYGLYDMLGNVSEIVDDCYHLDFDMDNDGNGDWTVGYPPWTDACTGSRVTRGGDYVRDANNCRVTSREALSDGASYTNVGFRCCRSVCTPDCAGKACGDDGCGGSCGVCGDGYECDAGSCEYAGEVWTDPATGLMWQVAYSGGQLALADAVTHCDGLSLGGFDNWRMPDITELRGLLRDCPTSELGAANCNVEEGGCLESTCNEGAFCLGCLYGAGPDNGCYWPDELAGTCGDFWSTTAVTDQAEHAWGVRFYYALLHDGPDDVGLFARCVREDCTPDCEGKECGDDGCGGSCGECGDGDTCWEYGCTAVQCDDGNEVDWDGCTNGVITETRVDGGTAWTSGQGTGTVLSSDAFAVAWQGQFEGDINGIGVRIFDADGSPTTDPFLGNTTTVNQQWYPDLAAGDNDEFLLAFSDNMLHAYGQVLNVAGGFPGSQLELTGAQKGTGDGLVRAIAVPGEQYLVTFGIKNDAQQRGLATVAVAASGTQAGTPIVVVATDNPFNSVTVLDHLLFNDVVAIIYEKDAARYVRRLSLPGLALQAEEPLTQFPYAAFVTNGVDTGYGVYAQGDPNQGQAEVLLQAFDATLAPLGEPATVLSGSKYASLRLCRSGSGALGIAWANEWDGGYIGAAIVDSQFALIASPVQANARHPGGLVLDDVLCFDDASTAVVWTQWKADETSVWFQRIGPDGAKTYPGQ